MIITRKKTILIFVILLSFSSIIIYQFRREIRYILNFYTQPKVELKLYEIKRSNFILNNGDKIQLINSAIKQDYDIFFSGNIVNFDTLIIGKGMERYQSSYLLITRDSIIFNIITHVKTRNAYKHNLRLKGDLSINIQRKVNSANVTIINEKDTFKIISGFVGMDNPFIHSLGSFINVSKFEFTCNDYYSDVYVFGDSYVSCYSPTRWPYYLYNNSFKFLCDGLPGGNSIDSYDYINSAFSVNKPKYVIWCLVT